MTDEMTSMEEELKVLIVETLRLEDVKPEDIVSTDPLFYEGLGLDSLDALELGVAISKKYNIKLTNDPDENKAAFASVAAMARFVADKRAQGN